MQRYNKYFIYTIACVVKSSTIFKTTAPKCAISALHDIRILRLALKTSHITAIFTLHPPPRHFSQYLAISRNISPFLAISRHFSLYLAISRNISQYLAISRYSCTASVHFRGLIDLLSHPTCIYNIHSILSREVQIVSCEVQIIVSREA